MLVARAAKPTLILALLATATLFACATKVEPPLELRSNDLSDGFTEVQRRFAMEPPSLERFARQGPIDVRLLENRHVRMSGGDFMVFDEAAPASAVKAPLVVLAHGNHSRKEAHRRQIEHLASYGLHAVALQLPNTDQWLANGHAVRRFLRRIRQRPSSLAGAVDFDRTILAGHSFGGSAMTIAAAGAPGSGKGPEGVVGLILLDPAVVAPSVKRSMNAVKVPTLLLAADPDVFRARKRRLFYEHLAGPVAELVVAGATHDDAQNPSMYAIGALGIDPFTSRFRQRVFTSALTLGAFSLAATERLDDVWSGSRRATARGLIKADRRRQARTVVTEPSRRSR